MHLLITPPYITIRMHSNPLCLPSISNNNLIRGWVCRYCLFLLLPQLRVCVVQGILVHAPRVETLYLMPMGLCQNISVLIVRAYIIVNYLGVQLNLVIFYESTVIRLMTGLCVQAVLCPPRIQMLLFVYHALRHWLVHPKALLSWGGIK